MFREFLPYCGLKLDAYFLRAILATKLYVILTILFLVFHALLGFTQPRKPLTLDDISHLIKSGVTPNRIARLVEENGVRFELDDRAFLRLKQDGANETVLDAVKGYGGKPARLILTRLEAENILQKHRGNLERCIKELKLCLFLDFVFQGQAEAGLNVDVLVGGETVAFEVEFEHPRLRLPRMFADSQENRSFLSPLQVSTGASSAHYGEICGLTF